MREAMKFNLCGSDTGSVSTCGIDVKHNFGASKHDNKLPDSIKNRYSPATLVNNWFDQRAVYKPPPDDWRSVYKVSYTCKGNKHLLEDRLAQKKLKVLIEVRITNHFFL